MLKKQLLSVEAFNVLKRLAVTLSKVSNSTILVNEYYLKNFLVLIETRFESLKLKLGSQESEKMMEKNDSFFNFASLQAYLVLSTEHFP